jgi:hypothetical protein
MTGTLNLGGSPPLTVPAGATSGYVLTSDGSGNITLAPAAGGGGGTTLTPVLKSGTYTTAAGEFVVGNATSASFTVTLPSAPADKSIVGAKMTVTASSHTVTVACGGTDVLNVASGSTSLTLSLLNQGVILQYASASGIWYVTGDDLPLGQLDSRYVQLGGDLGGTTAAPTVAKIQGTAISSPPGGTTQFLRGDGTWQVPAGGGGGMTNPMTTLGDLIYEDATPTAVRLAGNTAATRKFLRQTGTGSVSAAPAWDTLVTGDLPAGVALLSGAAFTGAVSTTGTLSVTGNTTASGTLAVSKAVTSGVFTLTDSSTITVDASKGNTFRLTLTASGHTMGTPSNPADGQMIIFEITQGASAYTLNWSSAYLFSTALPAPTITATASYVDVVGVKYASSAAKWRCLAISQGYSA